jgi:hypothetical protein
MRKGRLTTVAAAVLLCSASTAVRAGPATADLGASGLGQLPSVGGANPDGGGASVAASGPSFGGQKTPGAGFATSAPQGLPDADDPSLLPTDSGAKKQ